MISTLPEGYFFFSISARNARNPLRTIQPWVSESPSAMILSGSPASSFLIEFVNFIIFSSYRAVSG